MGLTTVLGCACLIVCAARPDPSQLVTRLKHVLSCALHKLRMLEEEEEEEEEEEGDGGEAHRDHSAGASGVFDAAAGNARRRLAWGCSCCC